MANKPEEDFIVIIFGLCALGALAVLFGMVLMVVGSVGATFGSGVSLYNYAIALKNNIKLEK